MIRQEFLYIFSKSVSLLNKYKDIVIQYCDIDSKDYRSEFSLLNKKGGTIKFGLYSESIFEKYLVENSKEGKLIPHRPKGKEYIEYMFNIKNYLEYIVYHYNNSKEIWKLYKESDNERVGIKIDGNCLIYSKKISEEITQIQRLNLNINDFISFEFIIENSCFKKDQIQCIRSVYNCKGGYVEKLEKSNNKFHSEVISKFNFCQYTIECIVSILQLDEAQKNNYFKQVARLKKIENDFININKELFENGDLLSTDEENDKSIY